VSGYPSGTRWVRFTWQTETLPSEAPAVSDTFSFGDAYEDDAARVTEVTIAAYGSDPIWTEMMPGIRVRMTARIEETFGSPSCRYVVCRTQGGEIVASSGVAIEHRTTQNLLTGVCVLGEHQQVGLGRRLLWESLQRLRELGVMVPCVYTEMGSLADRHIYPLFGSVREEDIEYLGAG
jgi:predicted N-acetyltransferase YhbS